MGLLQYVPNGPADSLAETNAEGGTRRPEGKLPSSLTHNESVHSPLTSSTKAAASSRPTLEGRRRWALKSRDSCTWVFGIGVRQG